MTDTADAIDLREGGARAQQVTDARVTGIDPLRAVAALAVFACHINQYWNLKGLPSKLPQALQSGAHGVDLFVVLSGFCLALPVSRRGYRTNARLFWARRASRLLPPYYVALAIAAFLAMYPPTAHHVVAEVASVRDLLLHVVLLQMWAPGVGGTINGSLWSIALEAHLYLTFPLVLWGWRRFGWQTVLASTAGVSIAWSIIAEMHPGSVFGDEHLLPARLVQFVGGMVCAELLRTGVKLDKRLLWAIVGIGFAAAVGSSSADIALASAVIWAVPCMALLLAVAGASEAAAPTRALSWFGVQSYSFYLIHQPLLLLTADLVGRHLRNGLFELGVGMTVGVGGVLVVAIVMNRLVERPSQAFGRQLAARAGAPV